MHEITAWNVNLNFLLSSALIFAGFVIGLGAVTVIDILGFLGRKSSYWTEATIRSHKVTKPLIWIGITLLLTGTLIGKDFFIFKNLYITRILMISALVLNGLFLSFYVSPFLIKQEKEGKANKILPNKLQYKIVISFMVSLFLWWSLFFISIFELMFL